MIRLWLFLKGLLGFCNGTKLIHDGDCGCDLHCAIVVGILLLGGFMLLSLLRGWGPYCKPGHHIETDMGM